MNKCLLLVDLILCIFFSCKNEKKVNPEVNQIQDTVESRSSFPASGEQTFKGLFVVGKTILSFRECANPEKDLAVIDSTGKMKDLYKAVFLHSPAFPNEYVYVEVKGKISPASDKDLKLGFDSSITITDVLTFEQKNYENSCIPYDFWVLGKNWSLQISEKEQMLVLKDFSEMKVYVFEYFPPKNENDEMYTYASNNYAASAALRVVIKKESCTEDSSQNSFQYSATAFVNGKVYRGCAIKGSVNQ